MHARHYSLIFALALLFVAGPVSAQVIPSPTAGRQLYVRNNAGQIIERLQPDGDRYSVFNIKRLLTPVGYAKLLGRRLVIYDLNDHPIASARAELLPPDSSLAAITIVRDSHGQAIGVLERY